MSETPGVHHIQVAIPAGGEDRARGFYRDLLGLTEIDKPASLHSLGGVWFSTGTIDLHLGVEANFAPAKKAHVAYQVADLAAVAEAMTHAGFAVIPDDRLPGFDRFYTEDPFGNRVEILTPTNASRTGAQ